jgi:hypothetical protein
MTKSDIGVRIKEILARHLDVRFSEITDNLVVGRMFISNKDLQLDLMLHVGVSMMYVNTPDATVAHFIKDTERQWDEMTDLERQRLATL